MAGFETIVRDIQSIFYNIPGYLNPILFIIGIICLTVGFKAYEYIVKLPGAILFCIVGATLGYKSGGFFLALLYGIIGLIAGGAIAWFFHQLAIWLTGAAIGVILCLSIYIGIIYTTPNLLVVLAAGIICGSFLLSIFEASVIIWTSFLGSLLIVVATSGLNFSWLFIVLLITGILLQSALEKVFITDSSGKINFSKSRKAIESDFLKFNKNTDKSKIICPDCKKPNVYTDNYCIECGCNLKNIEVKQKERFCIYCGAKLLEGKNYCHKCGTILI